MKEQAKVRENQIIGPSYRITMITPRMVRLEYQQDGKFQDELTQVVRNREFSTCEFRLIEKEEQLEIITDYIHVIYNKKEFSNQGLSIKVRGNLTVYHSTWNYGDSIEDLRGTARTLDLADGEVEIDQGILSWNGFSVLDDSHSFGVDKEGRLTPPVKNYIDFYFFGYGREYIDALKDYYHLTGNTPLLPRYALGNWWSRYYRYTQESYKDLIDKFEEKKVPLAVAVIDMDWHLVDIDSRYGSGWTGYTWNEELFPDYKEFLQWLHNRNLHVTLNVHPAEGVRGHEIMYQDMANELGIDSTHEDPIAFDITDSNFVEAYFKHIHHAYEKDGVDFWWLDWQQGSTSKIEGLDPLWLLNYYHYKDSCRNGKRGLILSRYAGPGSHRYPIGFSGDTVMSWRSLDFQPFFTANASNIGYTWWSHDIGGHMLGVRSEELAVRWLQFGVFSPIMRLHSSASPFNRKEPWTYRVMTEQIMIYYLQLRHRLLPYLYTMNYRCHKEGEPLIQPMYYHNPECREAYDVKNEYYFGTELIVSPITKKGNETILLGCSQVWLPEGIYIDCMTGLIYKGGRSLWMYRPIEQLPVLAKAGTIIPMAVLEGAKDSVNNPEKMDIYIYAGADGSFSLYEDDGITYAYQDGNYAITNMEWNYEEGIFTIHPVDGECNCIPPEREYRIHIIGFKSCEGVCVGRKDNSDMDLVTYDEDKGEYITEFYPVAVNQGQEFYICAEMHLAKNPVLKKVFELLDRAEIETLTKERIYDELKKDESPYSLSSLMQLNLEEDLFRAISEIILAY
ncbi:TIM-barrel domain-containing protein [Anaerosporobacter sp.]